MLVAYFRDTLLVDKVETEDEAILEIYRRLRPGDPATIDQRARFFHNLFFNPERYDLSKVGRVKLNYKFYLRRRSRRTPFYQSRHHGGCTLPSRAQERQRPGR